MPRSAHDVAAVLRERHPGLPRVKLHKLLYYCQGHHLAAFGEPLFGDAVSAWDMGPVVGSVWYAENQDGLSQGVGEPLGEAELNTIGYVLSRYGALSGRDLMHLTHQEEPWLLADAQRPPGTSARIEREWMERYFGATDQDDEEIVLDPRSVAEWLRDAGSRRDRPSRPDTPEEMDARIAELRARVGRGA